MLPRLLHYSTQSQPTHLTFQILPRPQHLPKDTCASLAHHPIRRQALRMQRIPLLRPHMRHKHDTSHSQVPRLNPITASNKHNSTIRCQTIRHGVLTGQLRSLGCSSARARWRPAKIMFRKTFVHVILCKDQSQIDSHRWHSSAGIFPCRSSSTILTYRTPMFCTNFVLYYSHGAIDHGHAKFVGQRLTARQKVGSRRARISIALTSISLVCLSPRDLLLFISDN